MRELPADKRRGTHLMIKGNFLNPREMVEPGLPAAFPPLPSGAPKNRLGLAHFFEQIIVSIDAGYTKPAPQIFRQALEVLGLEPNEILHVGDSENEDVAGPQALGIPALLLSRGSQEHGNGRVIGALTELTSLFQGR